MSDSSRSQMLISPETVFNEVPATPDMTAVRFLKSSIEPKNSTAPSEEIRADRSRSDLLLLGTDVAGNLDCEFPYGAHDSYIEATLCGTWTGGGNGSFANGIITGTTNLSSATATFLAGDVGKIVTGTGIPVGTYILARVDGTNVTLSQPATNGTSLAFVIQARTAANVLINGVTNRSFLLEEGAVDIATYIQYRGMCFDTWDLDITARKPIGCSFGFMGAQATVSANQDATPNAANTLPPITAGPWITGLESNTDMTGLKVKSLKMKVNNNLRLHEHVEAYASDDFGRGVQDVTGTMDVYFKNSALIARFLANTAAALSFTITCPLTGNKYVVSMPKVKLSAVSQQVPGVDADRMQTVGFRALFDTTTAGHLKITRGF